MRSRISDLFEEAALPGVSKEDLDTGPRGLFVYVGWRLWQDRDALLNFIIIGGPAWAEASEDDRPFSLFVFGILQTCKLVMSVEWRGIQEFFLSVNHLESRISLPSYFQTCVFTYHIYGVGWSHRMTFRRPHWFSGVEVAPLVWRLPLTWQISWKKIVSAYIPSCMMRRRVPSPQKNLPKALKGCRSGFQLEAQLLQASNRYYSQGFWADCSKNPTFSRY